MNFKGTLLRLNKLYRLLANTNYLLRYGKIKVRFMLCFHAYFIVVINIDFEYNLTIMMG